MRSSRRGCVPYGERCLGAAARRNELGSGGDRPSEAALAIAEELGLRSLAELCRGHLRLGA